MDSLLKSVTAAPTFILMLWWDLTHC